MTFYKFQTNINTKIYLSLKTRKLNQGSTTYEYAVKIPNNEIKEEFEDKINR